MGHHIGCALHQALASVPGSSSQELPLSPKSRAGSLHFLKSLAAYQFSEPDFKRFHETLVITAILPNEVGFF